MQAGLELTTLGDHEHGVRSATEGGGGGGDDSIDSDVDDEDDNEEDEEKAEAAKARYQEAYGRPVTTEITDVPTYYPAEDYHQQYLAKNPQGYCNHGPTGVSCPIPQRVSV